MRLSLFPLLSRRIRRVESLKTPLIAQHDDPVTGVSRDARI